MAQILMVKIRLPGGNNGSGRDGNIEKFLSFILIDITYIDGGQCIVNNLQSRVFSSLYYAGAGPLYSPLPGGRKTRGL